MRKKRAKALFLINTTKMILINLPILHHLYIACR
uniref:BTB/POZ domain-containing protein n=1 Tax=Myoviridae sp. ctCo31 TaxID=2825053 RepID=A0A8S5UMC9_9CAUD|nr:MAG TPA: BTB/POZ domain-containing protein [Myoviridae sp. ctCo31]